MNSSTLATPNDAANWPPYSMYAPYQINLNQVGSSE
jgi:hypothetical protein